MKPRTCVTLALALCVPATASAAILLQRTYDGAVPGGEFGSACVVIGDMDGDGFDEFAIGAPGDATGGAGAGRVLIYRGGHPLPDMPAWVITGEPGDRLGHALAMAYVDDDFVPDLLIGAPGSAAMPGRVVIAYGSATLGARPLRSVAGTAAGGHFGWAIAGSAWWTYMGPRFIVGAPEANAGAGEVHGITHGDPPAGTEFVLHGANAGERFGYAVADAGVTRGFINGNEFLVGAPDASTIAPSAGRYALFIHDAPDDTTAGFQQFGASEGEQLGHALTGGKDTNPNYFEPADEFVAGAPGASPGGRARVVGDQAAPFDYVGASAQAALGSAVRLVSDVTGSGLPDLCVSETDAVRVYTGPLHSWSLPAAILPAGGTGERFGHSISSSGRIDHEIGEHYQFLVGAPDHDGAGRVYVYGDPSPVTGVDLPVGAGRVSLSAPKPNPASAIVSFSVELSHATAARIAVYDVAGREVARVHEGRLEAGRTPFEWDSRSRAGPGLYFLSFDAGGVRMTRRLAIAR